EDTPQAEYISGLISVPTRMGELSRWLRGQDQEREGALPTESGASSRSNADGKVTQYLLNMRKFQRARAICRLVEREEWGAKLLAEVCSDGWKDHKLSRVPLAFELDVDIRMRPTQIDVAQELLDGKTDRLIEFSMGEGKTSVVMPVLLAAATRKGQLNRVTVLQHLLGTNLRQWQSKLGGVLDFRLQPLHFDRSRHFSADGVAGVLQMLQSSCDSGNTVLVMCPSDRLALENKRSELAAALHMTGDGEAEPESPVVSADAAENKDDIRLLQLAQFLDDNVQRDFIDESDQVLGTRTQLVYPIGSYTALAGGVDRYEAAMTCLRLLSDAGQQLQNEWTSQVVELADEKTAVSGFSYRAVRLLDHPNQSRAYESLKQMIANKVAEEIVAETSAAHFTPAERSAFLSAVISEDPVPHLATLPTQSLRNRACIFHGLLTHGVLLIALTKRHRVQYGANPH
ncbi:unnamed protein product, partial [Amoebophrya sp. A120]